MTNSNSLLVIARKFNDIFYAIETPIWDEFDYHILVICANQRFAKQFPLKEKFNKIIVFDSSQNRLSYGSILREINKKRKEIQCTVAITSNITLIVNQYILKASRCKNILLVEDGLMNYYNFTPKKNSWKRIAQFVLGINEHKLTKKILYTFLLDPDQAMYYKGQVAKLHITRPNLQLDIKQIENKKIFVGQCIYEFGYMTIKAYNKKVNETIQKYNIDYYIPHAFASHQEEIMCNTLDLNQLHVTLEILSTQTDFTIYSFSSSVLYSTKIINNRIKSYLIRIPELNEQSKLPIINKYCDGIINFN